ncbi:unnamed protein product [Phyllotreta striolata]|uniref:Mpv17-like protein 2 n=1 Tax=Phyllotreta striolata TaxID=444603 RepID=A0A9N9TWG3_PHYSR|nr:unnamed protein product [Phyllotreta striolata]
MFKFCGRILAISKTPLRVNFKQIVSRGISKTPPTPGRSPLAVIFSNKYLLTTNIVSSGVLMFIGDIAQQEIEYRQHTLEKRYDYGRLTRMFLVGLVLGPIHHYYYLWIAKKWPARTTKIITWKIGLDQFIMSPICIGAFFYGMSALENKSLRDSTVELKEKFMETYTVDWLVWPPTQFINFYYVPVRFQVFYINGVTMLYNVFLSYIKHKPLKEEIPS